MKKKIIACWTFAKTVEGKGLKTCQNLEVYYFLLNKDKFSAYASGLGNLCMVRRKIYP